MKEKMKRTLMIAQQVWSMSLKKRSSVWLIVFFNLLLILVAFTEYKSLVEHNKTTRILSHEVRENWEKNPDKHPHRMAHYGYVAFREKFPLSFFDSGMDNNLGNAIFLEAHKQNTVNFSEASLSNNLLRFGEISAGMICYLLLPLLMLFWGFGTITQERERGTLKLLLTQGVGWQQIILGKTMGLFFLLLSVFIPVVLFVFILLLINDTGSHAPQLYSRYFLVIACSLVYFLVFALLTVLVSARSRSSMLSLIILIGGWLFFSLVFPKVSKVVGQNLFPSPSKIEFDISAEHALLKQGDGHNPNDPYFNSLRDSLLTKYNVKTTKELPFNYSGYVMKEGERLSSEVYKQEKENLVQAYLKQQNVVKWTALLNPYIAIKNIVMALSGSDYNEYNNFQNQTEDYRYYIAQTMNDLQIKYIANDLKTSADKRGALDRHLWEDIDHFEYKFLSLEQILRREWFSILSLLLWLLGLVFITNKSIKIFKAY